MKRTPLLLLTLIAAVALFYRTASGQGVQIEKAPAGGQAPVAPAASPSQPKTPRPPTAAESLYDYLQEHRIEVAKFQAGTRYIWTDRVLIEISDGPPPEPLASLLALAPGNSSQFSTWVHDNFEAQVKAWRAASKNPHPPRQGTEEIIADSGANTHCFVNPLYVSYVLARYPKAKILIKGATDPLMFTVNGQLRAVVSPWTQLPDGTPLP